MNRFRSIRPTDAIAERYPTFSGYYFTVLKAINTFVANRWMLPEDAPHALNRMLNAGTATGAIKRDPAFEKMLQDAGTPIDQGFEAVSIAAPAAARAQ